MKKAIAIIMAILMAATLFACNTNIGTSPSPSASVATSETPSASASAEASAVPSPSASSDSGNSLVQKVDFQVKTDPFSRDKYKIAECNIFQSPFSAAMDECWKTLGEKLNYEFSTFNANSDIDQFMTQIETCAGQGYDGLIIQGDFTTQDRIFEIMKDYPDVKYMPGLSPFVTAEGKYLAPSAGMDNYNLGAAAMHYMLDNYESITKSGLEMKDIGFITVQFAIITDFNLRVNGAFDVYKELYPDLVATNYFPVDTSAETNPVSAEGAYNQVSPIIAAHPEIKGWIVWGVAEDYSDGASRALETAGLKDVSVVTSDACVTLMSKWDAGYDGCWVAGVDTPPMQWADATICGLVQLIDGTATWESLWQSYRESGQDYTVIHLPFTLVDKSNYKEYQIAANSYLSDQYPG